MMLVPALDALIERRILVNYRVDPDVARTLLPAALRPQLVDVSAVAGICLVRMKGLQPEWSPVSVPFRAENSAHRIAVEWDGPSGVRRGVFVPERHTASRLATVAGGRAFPGTYRRARFDITEAEGRYTATLTAASVSAHVDVEVTPTVESGLFPTLAAASAFFRGGDVSFSPTSQPGVLDGIRLEVPRWSMEPAHIHNAWSTFFEGLPAGSATLDSAFMMRNVAARWHGIGRQAALGHFASPAHDARVPQDTPREITLGAAVEVEVRS